MSIKAVPWGRLFGCNLKEYEFFYRKNIYYPYLSNGPGFQIVGDMSVANFTTKEGKIYDYRKNTKKVYKKVSSYRK